MLKVRLALGEMETAEKEAVLRLEMLKVRLALGEMETAEKEAVAGVDELKKTN
ncbi:uncharacterized protein A4U43_C09F12520, partial [Asparagus officinalis]